MCQLWIKSFGIGWRVGEEMPCALKDGEDTAEELCIFLLWGKKMFSNISFILPYNEECFPFSVQLFVNAACYSNFKILQKSSEE